MAQFKRATEAVDALPALIDAVASGVTDSFALKKSLEETAADIAALRRRASETDPDRKVYGPGMVAKVLALCATFDPLAEAAAAAITAAEDARAQRERDAAVAKAVEEARAAAEAEEKEKLAKAEAEAAAIAAANAKAEAARAAEEKRLADIAAAEEAKRVEAEKAAAAVAAADAKAKAIAAAKREKEEAEQAAALAEREDRRRRAEEVLAKHRKEAEVPVAAATPAPPAPAVVSAGNSYPSIKHGSVNLLTTAAEYQHVLSSFSDSVVVVDIFAPWCGPCNSVAPVLEAMAGRMPTVLFTKVNGDTPTAKAFLPPIQGFPTFNIFFRGKKLTTITGANVPKLNAAIVTAVEQAEETLLSEAIALSVKAAPAAPSAPASAAAGGPSAAAAVDIALPPSMIPVLTALIELQGSMSKPEFRKALRAVGDYVGAVVDEPWKADGHIILTSNMSFRAALGRHAKGPGVIEAIGFVRQSSEGSEGSFVFSPLTDSDDDTLKLVDLTTLREFITASLASDAPLSLPAPKTAVPPPVPATVAVSATGSAVTSTATAAAAAPAEMTEEELIALALQMSME